VPSSTDDMARLHAHWVVEAIDGGGEFWRWRPLRVVEAEERVVRIDVVSIGCGLGCVDGWLWERSKERWWLCIVTQQ
jgi:hypothetical protein